MLSYTVHTALIRRAVGLHSGPARPRRVLSIRAPSWRHPPRRVRAPGGTTMALTTLQRVAAGDPGSVQACLDKFGGLVWSLARRLAPADADDAVQEIFIDLWKSARRYDPRLAAEATFVAMIARRRLIDRRRRLARQPDAQPITDPDAPATPAEDSAVSVGEDAAAATLALAALSSDQQRVIKLAVYHGLSHDQISKATGLPLGTVKTHIRRGLIRVRETLDRSESQIRTGAES